MQQRRRSRPAFTEAAGSGPRASRKVSKDRFFVTPPVDRSARSPGNQSPRVRQSSGAPDDEIQPSARPYSAGGRSNLNPVSPVAGSRPIGPPQPVLIGSSQPQRPSQGQPRMLPNSNSPSPRERRISNGPTTKDFYSGWLKQGQRPRTAEHRPSIEGNTLGISWEMQEDTAEREARAATAIQSRARQNIAKQETATRKSESSAATKIQSHARRNSARQLLEVRQGEEKAATVIQSHARRQSARELVLELTEARVKETMREAECY